MRLLRVTPALLLFITLPASAADRWTRVGPDTASVLSLAAAPSRPATVYAGLTAGGVYRSTDAGQTWTWAAGGLDSFDYVRQLAVAPASPDTVYAVVNLSLYKTTNGGRSWQLLLHPEWETSGTVEGVAVHPRDGRIVYALSLDGPLRRSADGGISWSDLPGAPENISRLRIDPVHANVLYGAVINGPLWKSTDEGRTWRQIGEGLGPAPRIRSLEIHPGSPQVLYATRHNNGPALFQSKDGGATWAPIARGLGNTLFELLGAVPRGAQLTLFGLRSEIEGRRLYRSLDGGISWSEAGKGLRAPLFRISPVAATSGAILAPTFEGVFRSADGGRSWVPSSRNLKEHQVASLARGSALYIGVQGQGIYENAGRAPGWRRLPMGNKLAEDFFGILAAHPREPGRLYASTSLGIARSEDRGASWEVSDSGCLTADDIVTDPVDSDTLYITGHRELSRSSCRSSSGIPACGLQKSEDGGRTFNCSQRGLPQGDPTLLTVDPRQPSNLLVRAGEDLYRSTDGGASWSFLANFSDPNQILRALAFDPRDSNRVYAGILTAVARSADGGRTWTSSRAGLPRDAVLDLEVDPVDTKTLYAMTSRSGVFKSLDAGETWTPVGTGLAGLFANALLLDPRDRSTLYVQTSSDGLLKLTLSAP